VLGQTEPDIQTTRINQGEPTTELTGATVTIDNRVGKGQVVDVMLHEAKHAGEAKADPKKFQDDVRKEKAMDHDKRPQEQRAIDFAKTHKKALSEQAKRIRQEREKREREEKEKAKEKARAKEKANKAVP
jgi:hypothetical protein